MSPGRRTAGTTQVEAHAALSAVMATGIVSVAAADQGHRWLSLCLLALACALYVPLVLRAVRYRAVSVESFAVVAATSVIGARLALAGQRTVALGLCAAAGAGWLATWVRLRRLGSRTGIRLLAVVATQSLAVTAALSSAALGWPALVWFAGGLCLYCALIASWSPDDLRSGGGDVWITMGALAISALAAAALAPALPGLELGDVALALWAAAGAWLPLLVYAEARWRRLRYDPRRFATVFPLGMYSAASHSVGSVLHLDPLLVIARVALWVAVAAWLAVAAGELRRLPHASADRG